MSDEKPQANTQQAKTASEEQPAWTMPFPEMMAKMMARCGCCPEQTKTMWTICCGMSPEKKEESKAA